MTSFRHDVLKLTKIFFRTDDSEDRKAAIDHHKHDQLNKQKDDKGHWKKELSSNSEAAVSYFLSGKLSCGVEILGGGKEDEGERGVV
ncbi:MAG: hypothetical protein LQ343_005234 [Gyalolechia ehrenbergii]|nr:MAG: hypothetical protein LQ343_005234 [Gyalolechia ehrenbergii]